MTKRLLSESEGYALLDAAGIPYPRHQLATDTAGAKQAAAAIGYPVVLKIVSADIVHKSDIGGVALGIRDEEELLQAYERMMATAAEKMPDAKILGVIVEEELPHGLELIVGGTIDPAFGRVLTFGIGGTMVELLRDVSTRVLPLSDAGIRDMIRSIHGYPLIRGYRGGPPLDEEALVGSIGAVQELFLSNEGIVEFDINPLILYPDRVCAVDARIYLEDGAIPAAVPDKAPCDPAVLNPRSIALVGASSNPNKLGYAIMRNLLSFDGVVYAVNPNADELFGNPVYPSLLDLPGPADAVIVAVPAPLVPGIVDQAGQIGAKLAIIIAAGFRETGEAGKKLEEEMLAVAHKHGIRLLGPNCLGIMLPHHGLNATFDPSMPRPGHIAFISQSGAVITTVVDWSLAEEVGISQVVSVGNQADLEFEDFMQSAALDPRTKTIVLYIEEIKKGRQFYRFARRLSGKKPIVAIKSGSSERGREAASSHTGSLAGSYEVYQAAFRQAGVISAHSLHDAFNVAGLLASEGYPEGPRAVVITSAGGFAVLSSDYADRNGIQMVRFSDTLLQELNDVLPAAWSRRNPIDMVGDASVDRFARVLNILIRHQDEWDIAFVIAVPSVSLDSSHLAKEIVRFSMNTSKVIVGCMLGGESMRAGVRILRGHHIPNFSELEDAFRTVGIALERKRWLVEDGEVSGEERDG